MSDVKPWIKIDCYAEFPDDDLEADKALDALCEAVTDALNAAAIPGVHGGTWSVDDADAPPEGLS